MTQKDILLISVLFSLFYFLYWSNSILNIKIPLSYTLYLILTITVAISILNLLNQLNILILPSGLISKLNISEGSAISNDYNFFSLFILFGLVLINYRSRKDIFFHIYQKKWFIYLLNLLIILNVILSGSRRGIIILVLLFFAYWIYSIFFIKKVNIKLLLKKAIVFLIIAFSLFIIGLIVYQKVPKQKLSNIFFRYATLIGMSNINSFERLLWLRSTGFPKDKNHLIDKQSFIENIKYWNAYDAPGTVLTNLETPYGTGINMYRGNGDHGGFSLHYGGPSIIYYADHTYKISFKIKFISGNFNSFNVGFWVDDGGTGFSNSVALNKEIETIADGWYICSSQYTFINNHIGLDGFINSVADETSFIISDFELIDQDYDPNLPRYELEYRGKENLNNWINTLNPPWNKLNLIKNGDFTHGLSFWKHSSNSLTVKITNIDDKKCALISRGDGDGGDWSLYYGGDINFFANNEYQISLKIKLISPKTIPFNVGFWVNEGKGYKIALKYHIDTLENGWLNLKANYIFKNNQINLMFPINSQIDNSQFYIADINLVNLTKPQYQIKPAFQVEGTEKKETLFSGRTSRIKYALELWKTEYRWYNELFGHGFDYYEWFGKKFLDDPVRGDYPHNPFISVLLYSGILGLLFYFWLLYKVFFLYIHYRKKYGVLFICFLITFFFSFFSGDSPFDPTIMGFFILLPFYIHHCYKNQDKSDKADISKL